MSEFSKRTLTRREALLLSATAGIGIVAGESAVASDSTKTAAHQEPGNISTPRSAIAKTQYGKVRGFVDVALRKNYISVYLTVMKEGASLVQLYFSKLGSLKLGRNHFSFRAYEDLDVRLLASLLAAAEQILGFSGPTP